MTFLSNSLKYMLFSLSIIVFTSCALKAIPNNSSNIPQASKIPTSLDDLGNGKVMIYNGADVLRTIDNTARMNVWIDGKALGQIRAKEFVIIDLKEADYIFKLQHIDLTKFDTEHKVHWDVTKKVIRIEPTATSNKLTVTNTLPDNYQKFKYAKNR